MTILCRMQICANTLPFLALGNVGVKSANNSLKLCPEEFGHQSSPNPTKPRATTVGKKNQGLVVSVLPLLQSIVSTQMSIGRRRRKIRSLESTTCYMLHAEDAAKCTCYFLLETIFVIACLIVVPAFSVSFFVNPLVIHTFSDGSGCQPASRGLTPRPRGKALRRVMSTPFARHFRN
jgi:hypothetical protein